MLFDARKGNAGRSRQNGVEAWSIDVLGRWDASLLALNAVGIIDPATM